MDNHTDWKERARKYNEIQWVQDRKLLGVIIHNLNLTGKETVLDAGAGTGMLSKLLVNDAKKVYALDNSAEMLDQIQHEKIIVSVGNIKDTMFNENYFDRIVFRSVLHHCAGEVTAILNEAYRILKPGGKIVICEGVPVSNECVSDFAQVTTIKENRLVFTDEDMVRLLHRFQNVRMIDTVLPQQSINNWLDNCVDDPTIKKRIKKVHRLTTKAYKEAANMTVKDDDIFVDMRFAIVKGEK